MNKNVKLIVTDDNSLSLETFGFISKMINIPENDYATEEDFFTLFKQFKMPCPNLQRKAYDELGTETNSISESESYLTLLKFRRNIHKL